VSSEREKIVQAAQKYVEKKRYDRAILEYQKIVQQDPNDARTLLKIGDLQVRMQTYPEAIATYERVGQHYASQGFALKAIAVYKQIREIIKKHAPDLADRYGHIVPRLAEIYTQLGLTSDALSAYDEVATRLQRSGRERDAIEIFRKMVALDSTNPLPHLRHAEACCRVQSLDDAIGSFWTAAELLLKLGRPDDALKVIERILHFRPDPRYARAAAELYLKRGRREDGMQALARLQVCFQADPRDLDTLHLLAQAFTAIGQESKATEVYKEMARIAREAGKADLFEQLLAHLEDVAPDDEAVRSLATLPKMESREPAAEYPSVVPIADSQVEEIDALSSPSSLPDRRSRPPSVDIPISVQMPAAQPWREQAPVASAPDVQVVEDEIEVAPASASYDPGFDAHAHARKAIIDAESFRRLRLYGKALETLHIALEVDPRSIEIREKLRELLRESGDYDAAIGETITLASIFLEQGDAASAEALLYEVLDVEPEHPAALEMLTTLAQAHPEFAPPGYDAGPPVTAPSYAQASSFDQAYAEQYAPDGDQYRTGHASLPSYDLEEVSASSALATQQAELPGQPRYGRGEYAPSYDRIDDPFGSSGEDLDAPLPSFPLIDEEDLAAGTQAGAYVDEPAPFVRPSLPTFSDVEPTNWAAEAQPIASQPPPPFDAAADHSEAIEEALDEAEFFTSRGLYEDAKAILVDQLARVPNHPLVLERLGEIENMIASAGESGTIERSRLSEAAALQPDPTGADDDAVFDIAASLDALDQLEIEAPIAEAGAFAGANDEIDVDQVFAKFKQGVREQVAETDSATHYDLGVAYKEMGLLPDAIGEFEIAARDPARACPCYAMIGMIRLELGDLDLAAEAYKHALESEKKTVEQEMALYYDLGNVYEMKGSNDEALYFFNKIARRDPGYRDVKDRIEALMPQAPPKPQPQSRAVNDDEEFDRVFDDLFESK
jgi:tetratricopeptide (TPR) repeat protein